MNKKIEKATNLKYNSRGTWAIVDENGEIIEKFRMRWSANSMIKKRRKELYNPDLTIKQLKPYRYEKIEKRTMNKRKSILQGLNEPHNQFRTISHHKYSPVSLVKLVLEDIKRDLY